MRLGKDEPVRFYSLIFSSYFIVQMFCHLIPFDLIVVAAVRCPGPPKLVGEEEVFEPFSLLQVTPLPRGSQRSVAGSFRMVSEAQRPGPLHSRWYSSEKPSIALSVKLAEDL